jgi:preprotein translocase subunit SecG
MFGARGSASFLSRATAALATVFFVNAIVLAYLASGAVAPESLMDRATIEAPAADEPAMPEEDVPAVADDFSESDLPEIPDTP